MKHAKHSLQALVCALVFGLIAWLFVGTITWSLNMAEWSGFSRALFSLSCLAGLITGLVVKPGGFA